jgi:hypothetical protein
MLKQVLRKEMLSMPDQISEEELLKLDNTEKCDAIIKIILGEIEYVKEKKEG